MKANTLLHRMALAFLAILPITMPLTAQTTNDEARIVPFKQDTILTDIEMNEVVVKAAECIQRGDRKIYFPTTQQKKYSKNGLSLLEKMQLNGLQINSLFNTIDLTGGGTPQFCINGRPVELHDILTLKPDEITKIEYNENPGARYKDATAVINFKLKNAQQGGGLSTDLMEAFNTTYGVNRVSGKYNYKQSEWSINYNMLHASFNEFYNQNEETYHLISPSTGTQEITQKETGIPGRLHYNHHWLTLNYNYMLPDKWMFNVAFRGKSMNTPTQELTSSISQSMVPDELWTLNNFSKEHAHTALLDFYLQRMLSKNQTLIFDLTGSFTYTNSKLNYEILDNTTTLYSISTDVDGHKYALIAEGLYEKSFGLNKWSIGIKHTLGLADNKYTGTETTNNELHNSNTYAYTEWNQTAGAWNYAVSLGANYLWFEQQQKGYSRFYLQPTLRLSFTPSDHFFIRYRGQMSSKSPNLSELSKTEQTLDNFQIRQGNPALRPASQYTNQLTLSYHNNRWNSNLNFNYQYIDNAIMETTTQKGQYFIRSMANQKSWQKFNAEYEMQFRLLQGMLSFRGSIGVDYFDSRSSDYHHSYCNLYGSINAVVAYKCIALTFDLRTHRPTFYGETLTLGEDLHDIAITYIKKHYSISLAMNNPFMDNYRIGHENWNRIAPTRNYQYVNETSRMFLCKITYDLNFGRKYKTNKQRIQNEDTDTGILKGNKQ